MEKLIRVEPELIREISRNADILIDGGIMAWLHQEKQKGITAAQPSKTLSSVCMEGGGRVAVVTLRNGNGYLGTLRMTPEMFARFYEDKR